MKRIVLIFIWVICTLMVMGENHLMFHNIPIDGPLKTGMKQVKKMGFMGIKIDNIGMLMGTLDGEEVMLTLMATPKTKTIFCIAIMYDDYNTWEELMNKYKKVNELLIKKYGEPKEIINNWEAPFSLDNNPIQALKEEKGEYGAVYSTEHGEVSVGIAFAEEKLCILEVYVDTKNYELFEAEGGEDFEF